MAGHVVTSSTAALRTAAAVLPPHPHPHPRLHHLPPHHHCPDLLLVSVEKHGLHLQDVQVSQYLNA